MDAIGSWVGGGGGGEEGEGGGGKGGGGERRRRRRRKRRRKRLTQSLIVVPNFDLLKDSQIQCFDLSSSTSRTMNSNSIKH